MPEMVEIFSSFVSRKDLYNYIQVSSSWHQAFLPYLWKSFSLGSIGVWSRAINGETVDRQELNWVKTVFRKHSHFIRNMSVSTEFIWEVIINDKPGKGKKRKTSKKSSIPEFVLNLDSITITPYFNRRKLKTSTILQHNSTCWEFICSQPRLTSLTIGETNIRMDYISGHLKSLLLADPDALPTLLRLEVDIYDSDNIDDIDDIEKYIELPRNIQEFIGYIPEPDVQFRTCNHLRKITLTAVARFSTVMNFLKSAPKLHYFSALDIEISTADYRSNIFYKEDEDETLLLGEISDLRVFDFRSLDIDSYEEISLLIYFLPNLVEFTGEYIMTELSEALAKHCKSIERIIIVPKDDAMILEATERSYDTISVLLTSCQKLKVLDAKLFWLNGNKVPNNPWVCDNLEELHCRFEDFPNFDDSEQPELEKTLKKHREKKELTEYEETIFERWEMSFKLKRAVFKQISKLTSLRKLTLHSDARIDNIAQSDIKESYLSTRYVSKIDGNMYIRYCSSPEDSISMRLDDGLDELASLTKLQYLGFENLEHHMGKEEIEWIAANLPSLKEMRGLVDGAQIGVEPNYKNAELLALMKSLRSDITHTRRYNPKDSDSSEGSFTEGMNDYFLRERDDDW
ncbi:hypothetical protein BGZ76_002452 [Entomortierella beljakovae]|nr:hypothetical protein BGZ76_002452 [Entomortierella beljakovae]